jgi:hypothetical protein
MRRRDALGGSLGLVVYPGRMHHNPQIKPTLNNDQDANSRSVENRHTKEEVDDMWARPAGQMVGPADPTCQCLGIHFALVSSGVF